MATPSLKKALLALDHGAAPVFAVLDGAQFDDLPRALFDGDFISRPLYLDRGDNDPEKIVTAPHMVWLDERPEKPAGRATSETIPALLQIVGDQAAAVFWQCAGGGDVLYKHLRSINMLRLPKAALSADEQKFLASDHATVLFRHADANAMWQICENISYQLASRLLGPAHRILFKPDPIWLDHGGFVRVEMPEAHLEVTRGMLTLSNEDIENINRNRRAGLRRRALVEFVPRVNADPEHAERQILEAFDRAEGYELNEFEDIWKFIEMDIKYGYRFELSQKYSEAATELQYTEFSSTARLHNAERACLRISDGES